MREEHGFPRTECACSMCQVPCRLNPGGLDVSDLARLCPTGQDVFAWAEEHLRALVDKPWPVLVPARQANGHCHWHFDGKCAVHEGAPFGCAFFDSHMLAAEVDRRYAAMTDARQKDAAANGLYHQVWHHLRRKGLIGRPGKTAELAKEIHKIQKNTERQWRRVRIL
jgi:hypothetical protein